MFKSRWFSLLAILVIMGMLLSGCTKGTFTPTSEQQITTSTETTVSTTAPQKSQIVIIIPEDPPSFNPTITDTGYDSLVMKLVLLGLSGIGVDGNAYPQLAAELPIVDNGDVVIDETNATMDVTWKLRKDIQWSDGTSVTADDVVFTYNSLTNPETGSWIEGIDYVDGVDKVDDYTVVVHYNTIYPGYQTQFGSEQMAIWPAHFCNAEQGFSQWDCATQPLSDGPYTLAEWVHGDHMTFERNPKYYEPGKPTIDEIIVRIVPDETVRKQMLINGDADLDMWTTEPMIADLQNQPNVEVSLAPYNRWVMRIFFNLAAKGTTDPAATPHPVFSDVRVRQAVQMAIDVDTISKEFFLGYAKPVWSEFYRPPYSSCGIPRPVYDPTAAAALLEQAGWMDQNGDGVRECHGCSTAPEGTKMEMLFMTYGEYGDALTNTQQFIAEELANIGIKLNLQVVEGKILWAYSADGGLEQTGNFDIDIWDDGYGGNDPSDFLQSYYSSAAAVPDQGYNYGRYINPQIDDLINQSYTLDESVRADVFCQMAKILNTDLPELLLFTTIDANTHSTRVQGVQSNPNDIVTWNAADWTLK
jgi:peptide/nickel transport system substrate-binding protein